MLGMFIALCVFRPRLRESFGVPVLPFGHGPPLCNSFVAGALLSRRTCCASRIGSVVRKSCMSGAHFCGGRDCHRWPALPVALLPKVRLDGLHAVILALVRFRRN
mmetsp:Transcript_148931/g.478537  ORF Transcript_148931/g.478537 Transcript_148931/m.478537 type:complete len:105 (-) Transcript_148931:2457-2771(-)